MMKPVKRGAIAVLMGITLSSCTSAKGTLTQNFGKSHKLVIANQTLNPEASANLNAVEGFDGGATKRAIDRYYRSFERVPAQPRFVLRVSDFN